MKTIKENIKDEFSINRSVFITELIKVNNVDDVKNNLTNIKLKYKDATHYCYAYIIDENRKSSDDKEPSGTAGIQIMETLDIFNLNYVLCVVIRYFGGIKLGSGGLIRAYRNSVTNALRKAQLKDVLDGYKIVIKVPYNMQSKIESIIKDNFTKEYQDNVIYSIECTKEIKELLEKMCEIISIQNKKIVR